MADRSPAAKSEASTEEVPLGHVVGIFGVTGEVRLHLYNRESDLLRVSRLVSLTSPQGERREVKEITYNIKTNTTKPKKRYNLDQRNTNRSRSNKNR